MTHPQCTLPSTWSAEQLVFRTQYSTSGDTDIALPSMAQLQVAQEEEHRKHFMDFCTRKYYEEGGASCMHKNFTEMVGVMQCAIIWRLYLYHKLFVYVHS